MDYPEERDTEQVARLCPYCSTPYNGTNGVLIHLGQVAGRENHPEDGAEKHAEEDFPRVEVDERGNITTVLDDTTAPAQVNFDKGGVPLRRVYRLLADLMANDEVQTAHRVRKQLLGIDDADRPLRTTLVHPELFDALLRQHQNEDADGGVTATLEGTGIRVSCRGESGVYTAEDARDTVAGLEKVLTGRGFEDSEMEDLAQFLQYGADMLERETIGRTLHEEFTEWR
jgi:hypothetical protein